MTSRGDAGRRGRWAEDKALRHLKTHGLWILDRNYRCRHGEIDLVLLEGSVLVFTEVRYRGSGARVGAAHSVDQTKQARLWASAEHFLQRHPEHSNRRCRFDVVTIEGPCSSARLQWIKNAFDT